jgi:hypothetical protein
MLTATHGDELPAIVTEMISAVNDSRSSRRLIAICGRHESSGDVEAHSLGDRGPVEVFMVRLEELGGALALL